MTNQERTKAEGILSKVKKVALTGTAMAMMGGVLLTSGVGQADASQLGGQSYSVQKEPTFLERLDAEILKKQVHENTEPYVGNGKDSDRRDALEKKFGIKLDESDTWANKHLENPNYTSFDVLKDLGYYGVNASRQELIKYGIREKDWKPYNAFSAIYSPAHYEYVNGEFVQNKVYYGNLIESSLKRINLDRMNVNFGVKLSEDYITNRDASLKGLIQDFKDAPGITPYVVFLNSNDSYAKEYGVEKPNSDYFNSKWNHPTVMSQGKFSEKVQKEAQQAIEDKRKEEAKKAEKKSNLVVPSSEKEKDEEEDVA